MIDQQVRMLAAGEVTSAQLLTDCLTEITALDPRLRCFLEVDGTSAAIQAKASDRRRRRKTALSPLDGIPVAVKANLAIKGLAWSGGIAARAEKRASEDSGAVAALRAAGAVIVGTTNLAEAAMGALTANPWFGVCRNPALPDRHAGGSSGGSAAAVAAGMSSAALGSDTMGSVRIPAAWCGLAGWKPTPGLIPTTGLLPLSGRLDTVGILTKTVRDLQITAQAAGFVSKGPPTEDPPHLLTPIDLVEQTEPEVQKAFWEAVSRLGWDLERIRLGLDPALIRRAGLLAVEAEAYLYYRNEMSADPNGFSTRLRSMLEYAQVAPAWKLARSYRTLDTARDRIAELAVSDHHLLILPSTPRPPLPLDAAEPSDMGNLTAFVNAAGACAVSVPGLSVPSGPVGLQLVGRPHSDPFLLETAQALQEQL